MESLSCQAGSAARTSTVRRPDESAVVIYWRRFIAIVVLAGLIASPVLAGWFGLGGNRNVREIELKIQDASGKPISYATVWCYILRENNPDPMKPDMSDLWRMALRLKPESYEFVSNSVKPINGMGVNPMSDKRGISREQFPSGDKEAIEVGFVILKNGYLPAKLVTSTVTQPSDLSLVVTLQRDPASGPVPRYLEEFDSIRYEVTSIDIRDSGQVSSVSSLMQQLNELADEALRAGDKESAAKMLFYIGYLPSASPGGAQKVDFYSSQAIDARKKAFKLNANNAFIQARQFAVEGGQFDDIFAARGNTSPERLQAYAEYVERKRLFLDKLGERAWPTSHASLVNDYSKLGRWDKMNAEIDRIKQLEPKMPLPNKKKLN
ncbi:MAG: hypothetical protein A2Z01_05240 [Betaproteobacteria bacterium RBG_16_58_11]|nr:MAG: hypothetical protein A2Z01_05240 [Betaproteobacteria bacterium RBG_16_58_11]